MSPTFLLTSELPLVYVCVPGLALCDIVLYCVEFANLVLRDPMLSCEGAKIWTYCGFPGTRLENTAVLYKQLLQRIDESIYSSFSQRPYSKSMVLDCLVTCDNEQFVQALYE